MGGRRVVCRRVVVGVWFVGVWAVGVWAVSRWHTFYTHAHLNAHAHEQLHSKAANETQQCSDLCFLTLLFVDVKGYDVTALRGMA